MTNGEFYKVTFDEVLEFGPCFDYRDCNNELLRELFGDKTELTLNEIMLLEIPYEDQLWVMDRIFSDYDIAKIYTYTLDKRDFILGETLLLFYAIRLWLAVPTDANKQDVVFLQNKYRKQGLEVYDAHLLILCKFDLRNCYKKLCNYYGIRNFLPAINKFLAEEHVDD